MNPNGAFTYNNADRITVLAAGYYTVDIRARIVSASSAGTRELHLTVGGTAIRKLKAAATPTDTRLQGAFVLYLATSAQIGLAALTNDATAATIGFSDGEGDTGLTIIRHS